MSTGTETQQSSVSNIFDLFAGLANLYVKDRQAERENVAAHNVYAYNALAGADNSSMQNPYAVPLGTVGTGNQAPAAPAITTNHLIIGGIVLAAIIFAVK